MKLARVISVVILFISAGQVSGQLKVGSNYKMESLTPKKPIVCYKAIGDANTYVPPPASYLAWKKNKTARTKTATIIVTYDGFSPEAKNAFQAAVDIWETLIDSPVPIRISASWTSLGTNVLGQASASNFFRNFEGAQKVGAWYPIALAEKISRQELNGTDPDIVASFNSDNTSWSFNTQGLPSTGKYDMVSIVLHEIGHGLGITHSYEMSNGKGQISSLYSNAPVVFETFLESQLAANLVTGFSSPSDELGIQITSENLFLKSKLVLANNNSQRGSIYAPGTYSGGSSIAHLDDLIYPKGDKNSLMTPFINSSEVIHNPGPIIMGILKDMGWNEVFIQHTPLPSTEDLSHDFNVVCQIKNDTTFDASSMKLFYTSDGTTFTSKAMTPTSNTNEYQATIPKTGSTVTYGYYISLLDNAQRTFVNPGKEYVQGIASTKQTLNIFVAGPDTKPPHITHTPKGFIQNTETLLALNAIVLDNISIKKVEVEYLLNNVAQPLLTMSNTKDSTYEASISITGLVQGDNIKYRIVATDNAAISNVTVSPASGFYTVNVVSLAPVQDSYSNDFNSPTSDLFGDPQFSIITPSGFTNGAIHSAHPYPNGSGTNFESNYVYELRVPIKLKSGNATIKFDEIDLTEPSDAGAAFGSKNFYDYAIVEGSKDGGVTWKPFADGYNSRSQSKWLTKWNSSSDTETQPNSTAIGDPSLFISHTIDMLGNGNFLSGDEVLIRFRLFADQLVHGWGWAIDNLKIQIDETAPMILHNHSDYLISSATDFSIVTKVTDAGGLKALAIEYSTNNGTVTSTPVSITSGVDQYTLNLSLTGSGLKAGDEIQYRIKATDLSNNTALLPSTGFFRVSLLDFGSTLTSYTTDFNTANNDFAGNFFSITQPAGFSDAAIHSSHPYLNGFGLDNTSSYQYMLKKPVVIDATNPRLSFDEIVITEFTGTAVKDYVVVEGSKDKGVTWQPLLDSYSANANTAWAAAFNSNASGTSSLFKNRMIDITNTGKFKAGDAVLIRFRLMADAATNGWGWAIDNLSVQGPVTGLENITQDIFEVYPNPVSNDYVSIKLSQKFQGTSISIINLQGQSVVNATFNTSEDVQKIYLGNIVNGMYLVKVNSDAGVLTSKIIVKR